MQPIATRVAWSVCVCVFLLITRVSPAETDKTTEVPFGSGVVGAKETIALCGVHFGTIWLIRLNEICALRRCELQLS